MRARASRQLALAALGMIALALAGKLPELAQSLAYLLPAMILLAALASGHYPGQRALLELVGKRRHTRRRQHEPSPRPDHRPRALLPRGARLIAFSLAVRPPPPAAARVS
jgi:hypothetical protein